MTPAEARAYHAGMQAALVAAAHAIASGSSQGIPPAATLEQLYKAASVGAAGVVAPWFAPVVAALPADVATAIGLAPATGGQSLVLAIPGVTKAIDGVLSRFGFRF